MVLSHLLSLSLSGDIPAPLILMSGKLISDMMGYT